MEVGSNGKTRQMEAVVCARSATLTHIHLYGVPSTDRNSVLSDVVDHLEQHNKAVFINVNCVLVEGSSKRLIQEIVSCLPDSNASSKINSLEQLFDHIESSLDLDSLDRTLTIVFSYAEALLRFPSIYLRALFSSPKKYGGRVKLITVSVLPWSNFESVERLSSPLQFHFTSSSKDELLHTLCKRVPYGEKLVRLMLDTVYQICTDPVQLEYLMDSFWRQNEDVCRVLCDGAAETTSSDYRALQPKLRKCSEDLFYRFDSQSLQQIGADSVDLPTLTKFLLIAAYCASYNPASTDRRFFTKNHGKQKRRQADLNRDRSDSAHECGPKSFDSQRLLFVYLSLLELYDANRKGSSDIHTQVSELCRMGYLSKTSADGNLDVPKFKCIASFETMSRLAESLGIKLTDYLNDFTL